MKALRYGENHNTCSEYKNSSVLKCITRLLDLKCTRIGSNIAYGRELDTVKLRQRNIKRKVLDALFDNQILQRYKYRSLSWQQLYNLSWDTQLVMSAVAFRLRIKHRRFADADKLLELVDKIIVENEGVYEPILRTILCLANIEDDVSWKSNENISLVGRAIQRQDNGEIENMLMLKHEHVFPSLMCTFTKKKPEQPFSPFCGVLGLSVQKHQTCSELSTFFDMEQSDDSLFGGLIHSQASLNDKLSLPYLQHTHEIDLCRHLKTNKFCDEDEGFVSKGPASPVNEESNRGCDQSITFYDSLPEDNEPYIGYRKPDYDLNVWEKSLEVKLRKHRTWETMCNLCMPAASSEECWYLSEAGAEVYDIIWMQRWNLVADLAISLRRNSNASFKWLLIKEQTLIDHARLVTVGIVSDTFSYNSLAQMFIVRKDVHVKGITGLATRSLLSSFAEWGTAYRRLFHFSSCNPLHENESDKDRGVIFKVLCEGVQTYLQEYQRILLAHHFDDNSTLLQLHCAFRRAGSQISYLCRLCKCSSPKDATARINADNFPSSIAILTYLYEEAVHCSEATSYLLLLYLFKKCCQPYLEFVQNWVFRGACWDASGEFMLRVNADKVNRRDRQRWVNYVNVDGHDVASCVPSFLSPVAEDLLLCGKTVEFMNIICPEHFLCAQLIDIPHLLVTFSKKCMKQLICKWNIFHESMKSLEEERRRRWLQKEEDTLNSRIKNAVEVQAFHDQLLEANSRANKRLLQQIQRTKQAELERLKKQAEDDLKRRKWLKDVEKAEDISRIQEVKNKEVLAKIEQDRILKQEKQAMMEKYLLLCQEVDRRKLKAEWKIKRHKLDSIRLQYLVREEVMDKAGEASLDSDNEAAYEKMELYIREGCEETSQTSPSRHADKIIDDSEDASFIVEESGHHKDLISKSDSTSKSNAFSKQTMPKSHPSYQSIQSVPKKVRKTMLSHVSDESAPLKAKYSTAGGSQHVSQESREEVIPKIFRKSVQDKHVSQTTFNISNATPPVVTNRNDVSELPILPLHGDSKPNSNTTTNKGCQNAVHDSHSLQSVFELDEQSPSLPNQQINSNLQALPMVSLDGDKELFIEKPTRRLKKLVENFHVSDSSMNEILSEKISAHANLEFQRKLAVVQCCNKPLQHSSDSTIQNIMYEDSALDSVVENKPIKLFNLPTNHIKSRKSVKTLLYPENYTETPSNTEADTKAYSQFTLCLPEIGAYDDDNEYFSNALKSCKQADLCDVNFIDLLTSVVENTTNGDETDDVSSIISGNGGIGSIDLHALPILLRNSVIQPIKRQATLVNKCAVRYFMEELSLLSHFHILRQFFLLEDGEFAQTLSENLFELIHSGRRPCEVLNPVSLDYILSRSIQSSSHKPVSFADKLSFVVKVLPPSFNPTDLFVLSCLELRYNVAWPINVIISESCHNKYNQMLAFLLQLKLVAWSLHDIRARLNKIACTHSTISRITSSEVRKIHLFRHEMHNFVKVIQGYVSTQVLHVCWREFQYDLNNNVHTLDELHLRHAEYINKCILRCLLTRKAQNVMNIICDVLKSILRFRFQLSNPSTSNYSVLERTYQEFARLSHFLYKVVSKLVQRGYQPHLEDFLIRLNYNNFYKL